MPLPDDDDVVEFPDDWLSDMLAAFNTVPRAGYLAANVVQDEITNRMLASTPATELLSAMGKGISSSRGFLDSALGKLSGGGGGFSKSITLGMIRHDWPVRRLNSSPARSTMLLVQVSSQRE